MAQATLPPDALYPPAATSRTKFLVGGALILAAIAYLIVNGTLNSAQFFLTVDELLADPESRVGENVRLSGVVLGETIGTLIDAAGAK